MSASFLPLSTLTLTLCLLRALFFRGRISSFVAPPSVSLSLSLALKWPRRVTSFFGPDSDRAAAYIFLAICTVFLSLEYLQHSRISALMRISKAH